MIEMMKTWYATMAERFLMAPDWVWYAGAGVTAIMVGILITYVIAFMHQFKKN